MMFRTAAFAAFPVICLISVPALAQEGFSAHLSLGVTSGEFEDEDVDASVADFQGSYRSGTFGVDFGLTNADGSSDAGVDPSLFNVYVAPKYFFAPEVGVGGYLSSTTLSDDGEDVTLESYGLEGVYASPTTETTLFVGTSDSADFGDVAFTDVGLSVETTLVNGLELYGKAVNSSTQEDDDVDFSVTTYGFGGAYAFGQGFSVNGGLGLARSDDLDAKLNTATLGASYRLDQFGAPISVDGAYTHYDFDGDGADGSGHSLSLGATVYLGARGANALPGSTPNRTISRTDRSAMPFIG